VASLSAWEISAQTKRLEKKKVITTRDKIYALCFLGLSMECLEEGKRFKGY